ncbi:hypothetical protein Leryth_022632 [Lithospermum erythrorhizon]|nr:hypothetical protein Leryth_022632 [Lithospermum erythrorhizon]
MQFCYAIDQLMPRSKLGHVTVEDCNMALNVFHSYKRKPSLGEQATNTKMERWEAAIQDYEALVQEYTEDMEVNALVDVEESSDIAKSEGVTAIPAFKVFKKGSILKDIIGKDCDSLESTVKFYSS